MYLVSTYNPASLSTLGRKMGDTTAHSFCIVAHLLCEGKGDHSALPLSHLTLLASVAGLATFDTDMPCDYNCEEKAV
jgi:hypothetical protein